MTKKDIKSLMIIIEKALNLKIRGGRGYSAGHPYDGNKIKQVYGKSSYDIIQEPNKSNSKEPVQISRAFIKEVEGE